MTFVEAIRLIGLVLLLLAVPLLVVGQSAGDCLVVALAGFGLNQFGSP